MGISSPARLNIQTWRSQWKNRQCSILQRRLRIGPPPEASSVLTQPPLSLPDSDANTARALSGRAIIDYYLHMQFFAHQPLPDLGPYVGLRGEIRAFLAEERQRAGIDQWVGSWEGHDRDFSARLAERGWVGMALPTAYGGHDKGILERYVVFEELLAGGAPVAAHWIADRQSGPLILRFGTEAQRQHFLPRIASTEYTFAIGMSEPDSGSDLAAARTKAEWRGNGWRINGAKIWTSNAHRADWMITLCRTGDVGEDRHGGLSQFLIDLKAPDIKIRPIQNLAGDHHFNEVVFEDHDIAADRIIGSPGDGWRQVMNELAFERSAPDRYLSTFRLIVELVRAAGATPDHAIAGEVGALYARLVGVRMLSMQVAAALDQGKTPNTEAALVKEIGTALEQDTPEVARRVLSETPDGARDGLLEELLTYDTLHTPSFTLRGGAREIVRGIIARGIGLR